MSHLRPNAHLDVGNVPCPVLAGPEAVLTALQPSSTVTIRRNFRPVHGSGNDRGRVVSLAWLDEDL